MNNEAVPREPEVIIEINTINETATRLASVITALEERLSMVLRPPAPSDTEEKNYGPWSH